MVSRREFLGLACLSVAAFGSYSVPIRSGESHADGQGESVDGSHGEAETAESAATQGESNTPQSESGVKTTQSRSDRRTTPSQTRDAGSEDSGENPQKSTDNTETTGQTTVRNVLDYGAVGDGNVDDTGTIQRAFDDANDGETIYLPAGTYRVSAHHSTGQSALALESYRHPDNLTVEGDGEKTVILMDGGHQKVHIALSVAVGDGYKGLTIRDLVIDGNNREQAGQLARQVGNGLVVRDSTEAAAGNIDIRIENLKVRNANMNGFRIRNGGVTMDHVSAVGNGRHGFALDSRSDGHIYDPPITVRNAYASGNGVVNGNGHGFDLSGGKLVLEDSISEGNYQGTKSTEEVFEATYRRVLLANNEGHGYIRPGSESVIGQRSLVTFDDVVATENGSSGFRFGQDTDYTIGRAVARRNGQTEEKQNIRIRDNAKVEADEIFCFDGTYGAGISCDSTQPSWVDSYVHHDHPGGPLHLPGGQLEVRAAYRLPPSVFETPEHHVSPRVDVPFENCGNLPALDAVGVSWD